MRRYNKKIHTIKQLPQLIRRKFRYIITRVAALQKINKMPENKLIFNSELKQNYHEIINEKIIVIGSPKNNSGLSSCVRLRNIRNHDRELKIANDYKGSLIAVHINKIIVAYAMRTNGIEKNERHFIRIVNIKTGEKATIIGFCNQVLDMKFYNNNSILLASTDGSYIYIDKISSLNDIERILQIETPHATGPQNHQIFWCTSRIKENLQYDDLKEYLVYSQGKNLLCIDVRNLTNSSDCEGEFNLNGAGGAGDDGYKISIENTSEITTVCWESSTQQLCVAGKDGLINFYLVMPSEIRFIRSIQAHNGEAISSMLIVDRFATNNYFAITASNENSELKLWDCRTWKCAQEIQIISANNEAATTTDSSNEPMSLHIEIDSNSSHIILITKYLNHIQFIYIIQIVVSPHQELVYFKSISEFSIISDMILSLSVIDTGIRKFKCSTFEDYQLTKDLKDYDEHSQSVYCVTVRLMGITAKCLQDFLILYQPSVDDSYDIKSTVVGDGDWLIDDLNEFFEDCSETREFNDTFVIAKRNNSECGNSVCGAGDSEFELNMQNRDEPAYVDFCPSLMGEESFDGNCSIYRNDFNDKRNSNRQVTHSCNALRTMRNSSVYSNQYNSKATFTCPCETSAKINQLIELITLQSQQINNLRTEIAEMNASESSTTTNTTTNNDYRDELDFTKKMENLITQRIAEYFQIYEQKLNTSVNIYNNDYEQLIAKNITQTITDELNESLIPEMLEKIDKVQQDFKSDVIGKIIATFQTLEYENFAQICRNIIEEVIFNSAILEIQKDLKQVLFMSNDLIAQYEKSSESIFRQLFKTFSLGIHEVTDLFDQYLSNFSPINKKVDVILNVILEYKRMVEEKQLVDPLLKQQEENTADAGSTSEVSPKDSARTTDNKTQKSSKSKVDIQTNRKSSQSSMEPFAALKDRIKDFIRQGELNDAFKLALNTNDGDIFDFALLSFEDEKINVLRCNNLDQKILLAMIKYISMKMSTRTSLVRQKFLFRGIQVLNHKDPVIHAILNKVLESCKEFLSKSSVSILCSSVQVTIRAIEKTL